MGTEAAAAEVAVMMDAADHSISMLSSISIGLFALVGLAISFPGSDKLQISRTDWIVLFLFAAASVASFYFAYLTRSVATYYANGMIFPFKGIDTLVAWQAVCVGIAAIFAIAAAASQLLRRASLP